MILSESYKYYKPCRKGYKVAQAESINRDFKYVKERCDAKVSCKSDYTVFRNWWSSGRRFNWTRSNNMWSAGCFNGTGQGLIN